MNIKQRVKRLSRFEAQMVADHLRSLGKELVSGWLAVYRLTPAEAALKFGLKEADIVKAARRTEDEK